MKKTRRIIAGVAALTMAISMSISTAVFTASAEVGTTIISCTQDDTHEYKGYQIFVGNVQTVQGTKLIMPDTDLALGEAVDEDAFYDALELDDSEGKERNVANALEAFSKLDAARAVELIKGDDTHDGILLEDSGRDIDADGTPFNTGYVYVEEIDPYDDVTGDILKIAEGETLRVTPKAGKPKVEKKVQEDDRDVDTGSVIDDDLYEETFNDCADYSIGDNVPFEVVGTMPANIANYRHYYYEFIDRLGKGFKTPTDITVTVDGIAIDSSEYTPTVIPATGETDRETTISIKFDDIKAAVPTINAASKVVVTYNAVLDDDADTTLNGNTNEVYLRYSTDTEYDGDGIDDHDDHDTTEDTNKDGVAVFTYSVDVDKVNAKNTDEKLPGAQFVLLDSQNIPGTVDTETGKVVWDRQPINVEDLDETSTYKFELTDGLVLKGLDSGEYKLVEVVAPEGYVKLTNPVSFTIEVAEDTLNADGTWDWDNNYTDNARTAWERGTFPTVVGVGFDIAYNDSHEMFEGTIGNEEGINLPETGGIGTKIFFGVGGAAVLTSGVILVAKKRAKKED